MQRQPTVLLLLLRVLPLLWEGLRRPPLDASSVALCLRDVQAAIQAVFRSRRAGWCAVKCLSDRYASLIAAQFLNW